MSLPYKWFPGTSRLYLSLHIVISSICTCSTVNWEGGMLTHPPVSGRQGMDH